MEEKLGRKMTRHWFGWKRWNFK